MLFRQLEYFVAVAQERHFARAAEKCYVSQPAVFGNRQARTRTQRHPDQSRTQFRRPYSRG